METRPTLDKKFAVKPTRPGWKAFIVVAALIGGIFAYVSVMQV